MKNIVIIILFFILVLTGCNRQMPAVQNNEEAKTSLALAGNKKLTSRDNPMSSAEQVADKLEIYYFHRNARCYSCKTIGQYTKETMEQKYSQQIKDGLIDFRELNVESPENKEIAMKFQASGSSLFINRIVGSKDNIEQDTNVWRLLSDETKFKSYLENKINSYLGI